MTLLNCLLWGFSEALFTSVTTGKFQGAVLQIIVVVVAVVFVA